MYGNIIYWSVNNIDCINIESNNGNITINKDLIIKGTKLIFNDIVYTSINPLWCAGYVNTNCDIIKSNGRYYFSCSISIEKLYTITYDITYYSSDYIIIIDTIINKVFSIKPIFIFPVIITKNINYFTFYIYDNNGNKYIEDFNFIMLA